MKLRLLTIPVLIMIMTGSFFNDFAVKIEFDSGWQPHTEEDVICGFPECEVSIDCQAKISGYWMEEELGSRGKGLRLPPEPFLFLYAGYTCEVWVFVPEDYEGQTWKWNFLSGYEHFWVEKNGQEIYREEENRSVSNPQEDHHYSNILSYSTNSPDRNAEYKFFGLLPGETNKWPVARSAR